MSPDTIDDLLPQEQRILRTMKMLGDATWEHIKVEARLPFITREFFTANKLICKSGQKLDARNPTYALTEKAMKMMESKS
jgi:hypothetical protein